VPPPAIPHRALYAAERPWPPPAVSQYINDNFIKKHLYITAEI
jgi:hypothetical protein